MRLRQATLPYPPLDPASVSAEPWTTREGDRLPERLVDWDPSTDLHLFRELELAPASARIVCHLPHDGRLGILPLARSDLTGLRIAGSMQVTETDSERTRVSLALHLRGEALGGALTITTSIVTLDLNPADPIGPQLAGSELWRDEVRCDLEGAAARFPVSALDFSAVPTLDPGAAWTVDWRPSDLADPAMGAIRLLVNSGNPRIRAAVISRSTDPGADVVRAGIQHDVARSLILTALDIEEFVEDPGQFPDTSIGRAIADLVALHWPSDDVASIAARARDFPQLFEMELQSRFPPVPIDR